MGTDVTIGDFSRMSHLSIKTLRHYHQVGLLVPVYVDPGTGYRHYGSDQLATAQVIRRFRDLSMPIDEVRAILQADDVATRNELIAAHLGRLEDRLEQTRSAVSSLRTLIEQPDPSVVVEHRAVPATTVLAVREEIGLDAIHRWWADAFSEIDVAMAASDVEPAGPRGGLYADELFEEERGEATVFVPVAGTPPVTGRVRALELPPAELAVAVHLGAHQDIDRTYGALGTYVAGHALGVEGPVRESYLIAEFDTPDPRLWKTEVGWPIFRTSVP